MCIRDSGCTEKIPLGIANGRTNQAAGRDEPLLLDLLGAVPRLPGDPPQRRPRLLPGGREDGAPRGLARQRRVQA
eukprot:14744371-Alexandrium_andersonii.AAC.1